MARPCEYDEAIFNELMERLAGGETLKAICSEDKYPDASTIRRWVVADLHGVSARYTRAREEQVHAMIDETIAISDDTSRDTIQKYGKDGEAYDAPDNEWINRSRLRVDTRKWLASKIVPKIYGDRLDLKNTIEAGDSLTLLLEKIGQKGAASGNG